MDISFNERVELDYRENSFLLRKRDIVLYSQSFCVKIVLYTNLIKLFRIFKKISTHTDMCD